MKQITLYVEGGGDIVSQQAPLRQGLDTLLEPQKKRARDKKMGWSLQCLGGRIAAIDSFLHHLSEQPETIHVLLVDSEGPMALVPKESADDAVVRSTYLAVRDKKVLAGAPAENIHLMVQTMEAWIIADAEALAKYYGQDFHVKALSKRVNLEEEPKEGLFKQLVAATKDTTKGEYHKIKHASAILKLIDPSKVALRCPRFKLFTDWLDQTIAGA